MKLCSPSLVRREMKIEITMYTLPTRMNKILETDYSRM